MIVVEVLLLVIGFVLTLANGIEFSLWLADETRDVADAQVKRARRRLILGLVLMLIGFALFA